MNKRSPVTGQAAPAVFWPVFALSSSCLYSRTIRGGHCSDVVQAVASACSRSAHSASGSSRPTERRSSPAGIRSPSHRWRASSLERVPPRLVALTIAAHRALDATCGLAVGHVEADQEREARVAHRGRPPGAPRAARRASRALASWRSRRASSVSSPRSTSQAVSAGATMPASRRVWCSRSRSSGRARRRRRRGRRRGRRGSSSREWRATSHPWSSGRSRSGDATVASQTTGAGCAAAASRSGMVRIGFAGASTRIRSASSGGGAGLVELDDVHAPRREVAEQRAVPVVRALGERDRPAGPQHRQHDAGHGRHPGGEEQRVPALECSERLLAGDAGRVVGPRVREARRARRPRTARSTSGRAASPRLDAIRAAGARGRWARGRRSRACGRARARRACGGSTSSRRAAPRPR